MRTKPSCFDTRAAKQHSMTEWAVSIGTNVLLIIEKVGDCAENNANTDQGVGDPAWKLYRSKGWLFGALTALTVAYRDWDT